MSEYRCPHGRMHINGAGLLSYHERQSEWGNKPGYELFLDGTVQCSDCIRDNTDKLAAEIRLGDMLREAERDYRRSLSHGLAMPI
jgi:hypothetical protein